MKVTESQLKALIKHIILEAVSKGKIGKRLAEEIEPVIQKRPDQNHEFDDGRSSAMKAVNVGESDGGNQSVQMNPIATYQQQGLKCGQASKRKDQGLVSSIQGWFNKAIRMEREPYATQARKTYTDAYRQGAGASNPPQYFKEISFGSIFGKKKQDNEELDMNSVQHIVKTAMDNAQGNKVKAIAALTQTMNSADPKSKDTYKIAIHYVRNSNNNYRPQHSNVGQRDVNFVGEETKSNGRYRDNMESGAAVKKLHGLNETSKNPWIYPQDFKTVKNYINLKKNRNTGEFVVYWFENGRVNDGKSYFTDDIVDAQSTFNHLKKDVDRENGSSTVSEETGTGAVGGYSTPFAFSKKKMGSGRAISAAKKYGKVVKSISEQEQS